MSIVGFFLMPSGSEAKAIINFKDHSGSDPASGAIRVVRRANLYPERPENLVFFVGWSVFCRVAKLLHAEGSE